MARMTPYKQAACVTGTYTDRDGNEKKRYVNVGTLFQYEDGGLALKLDSIPVGQGWNGFVSFFDIKARDGAAPAKSQTADTPFDDDLPY